MLSGRRNRSSLVHKFSSEFSWRNFLTFASMAFLFVGAQLCRQLLSGPFSVSVL